MYENSCEGGETYMDGGNSGTDIKVEAPASAETSAPESPVGEASVLEPAAAARARAGMDPVAKSEAEEALEKLPAATAELRAAANSPAQLRAVEETASVVGANLQANNLDAAMHVAEQGEQDARHDDQVTDAVQAAAEELKPAA